VPLYWGDLHGHSNLSDGRRSPEAYFTYARDEAGLDFCSLTDHVDHVPASRLGLMSDESWAEVREATNRFNEPGRFVSLLGLKRSVPSWDRPTPGSLCVYYRGTDGPMLRPDHPLRDWLRPRGVDGEAEMTRLWRALAEVPCLRAVVHSASDRQGYCWSQAPPKYGVDLVEVYSKRGCCETAAAPFPMLSADGTGPRPGGTVHDALAAGVRPGFIAGSGTHLGMPGSDRWENDWAGTARYDKSGLTAVYAEELTREAIFDALKERRCYAATHERIHLEFSVNRQPMGSVLTAPDGPLRLQICATGTRPIKRLEVFRDGAIIHHKTGGREEAELIIDESPPAGPTWYYARVTQSGEDYAWSSPIWIEP
jgi:hypothetical protein